MARAWGWLARVLLITIIGAAGLGPAAPAHAAEWVQNFAETPLWSGPDTNAISFGTAPQWDYFQIISSAPGGRLYVVVERTKGLAYIDARVVGPSGAPPLGWPATTPAAPPAAAATLQPPSGSQPVIGAVPGFNIAADQALWPALQLLQRYQHTWTLGALAATGTRLEWAVLPADAAGMYQPDRALITINTRWYRSDVRALAAVIEHEAKHAADLLAGLDVSSPAGCMRTEINAFYEEAKTWGELVGPNGKANPRDELEQSLNYKLSVLRRNPSAIEELILRSPGYRMQCRL